MVGQGSELEPEGAKLSEAQGRGENVPDRTAGARNHKGMLSLAIGPLGC